MAKRTCKTLTLAERVDVLKRLDAKESQTSIASSLGVNQSAISRIHKNKEKILDCWRNNSNPERKRRRAGRAEDVETSLLNWFSQARRGQMPVSGPLLMEKAGQLAHGLGMTDFKASGGWLERWKARNNIRFKKPHGERRDADAFSAELNMDTLLRCPICFDYLNISMMAQHCSHNFCSLCIRKFLSYKLQCPVCNLVTTESDLRNNRALDDLVKSFRSARQQLLKINFESPPISPKTPKTPSKLKLSNPKGSSTLKTENTIISCFLQKGNISSPSQQAKPQSAHEDNEDTMQKRQSTVKEEPVELPTTSSASSNYEVPSSLSDVKSVVKVECPVCGVGISQQYINKHLDSCLTRDEKKDSLRSSVSKRKTMAKVVYDLLSDRELKKRLKDVLLSTQGSRHQLIKRHQDFVHMYNAQCDSLTPKSAQEIAKEVEKNEKLRTQLEGKSKSVPVMIFAKNQSEEEIDELHSNYRKQHRDEFSHLIAQVKGRWKKLGTMQVNEEPTRGHQDGKCSTERCETMPCSCIKTLEMPTEDGLLPFQVPISPSSSDVSISSSCSDVFLSDSADESHDETEKTPIRKRKSCHSKDENFVPDSAMRKRFKKS
ncbi:E3 ubiquitin-protein ligase RAD18 isoform X2 [Amia ocellicauda]|uniref:E3 ubiquitin-protein ligase RAD18 isoform X2 n=1 Tax=Amia ocellicauda TaxID=2972642 RepID=UPI003463A093